MNKFYKKSLLSYLMALGMFASHESYADGSKDLYPSGATGHRAFLVSTTNTTTNNWLFTTLGVHYVYVNPGEKVAAASSAQGVGNGQIRLTAPDGTVYLSTVGSTTGKIANRTEELQGPLVGYTPFVRTVGSNQGGLWKVEFIPVNTLDGNGFNGGTVLADAAWTQNTTNNSIAAWDVSALSASNTIIPGRMYSNVMNMYVDNGNFYGNFYIQTNDGYTYKVNNNGMAGIGFTFFVNNKGIATSTADNATPTYKSLNSTASIPTKDPRSADGAQSVTQKIFYTTPAADLPASALLPDGSTTWLKVPKVVPTVSNISIDGVEGTVGQVSSKGAYIKFTANQAGNFRITLTGSGSFVTRTINGFASAGVNSIFWNGKDGAGTSPSLGTAAITADIRLQGAEVHFPFIDVEYNVNGIIIEQLNDNGTVKTDIVYWDDSNLASAAGASSPMANGNSGSGLSSNSNGHKWSSNFGDAKTMDTWTYILGDIASKNTNLVIRQSDLAVQGITTSGSVTTVAAGQPVTYTIPVVNNGPSDVTGAPFAFKVPSGFTISNISYTTSCGTVRNAATDASGNYSALLDIPNGCIITFNITGIPGAALAGSSLNMEASVMRPSDVTDPDATNPDVAVPPTDPHVECKNGTTTESCNNIKYNTGVTVTASADIVTVKKLKDAAKTTFAPGEAVVYTITVTNNGPSDATNVNVQDAAPAGTSISAWTATVTTGTATLPATSGTGNLNQTISTLPNGAVVTYEVTVQTPANYTGSLSNTATVTSGTSDPNPDPTCPTCTAASIPATPSADIVTVKKLKDAAKTTFAPGEAVVYTITVTNNGPSDATNVNVQDAAPAGTSISTWTATVTTGTVTLPASSGTGNLNQTISTLPNGAVVTYEVTVQTPANYTGSLSNTATVTSGTSDPNPDPTCPTCTAAGIPATPSADIVTVKKLKDAAKTTFAPGEAVVYTITVTNNGPSDATNVNVQDAAPAGTSISAWTATVTTGTVTLPANSGTGNLNQTISTLPNGAVVTYEVTVQTPADYTGSLSNTATVTSGTSDPNPDPSCPTCTAASIPATPSADIVTVKKLKDAAKTTFAPGEAVVYTITVTNNGPSDATNVNVQDAAPAGTSISAWTATVTTGTVTLPANSGTSNLNQTISTLPNGAVVTYEVTVQTPANYTGSLSNTATVTSGTSDPNPDPTCPTCTAASIPATPSADIVTVKKLKDAAKTTFAPGEAVVYTITVANNGPSDATNVNVQDAAPAGTSISTWTATVTTGTVTLPASSGTGNLNQTISTLPNGAVVTYEVTVQTPADYTGSLSNTATVTSGTSDPNPDPTCPTCTAASIPATPSADIVTVKKLKDAAKTTFAPGEAVVYTITVTNNGPSDATNVNVQDAAPAGTSISAWTATVATGTVTLPATSGTGNLNQTITTLPNGAVVTYEVTVQTPISYTGSLSNTAAVTSSTNDPNPGCAACTAPTITATTLAPPTTTNDVVNIKEGSNITIPVLTNDVAGGASIVPSTLEIVTQPQHGTVTVNTDGTVVYAPEVNYNGTDTFTYRVKDAAGNWSNTATVDITVTPTPPVAGNDVVNTKEGSNVTIPVLTNDAPQGSPIVPSTLEIVTQPQHGTVTVNTDGTVVYTPGANYNGTDSFTYRVKDAAGNWSNTATVGVTVTPTPPIAENDAADTKEGSNVTIPVLTNDAPQGSPIVPSTLEIVTQPQHGTVTVNTDGTVVYTPGANYNGTDSFTYRVKDAAGNWSNTATVGVTVT
ncbi:Ig-like domain-containing protein, partial [Chitinophaga tropicalis]